MSDPLTPFTATEPVYRKRLNDVKKPLADGVEELLRFAQKKLSPSLLEWHAFDDRKHRVIGARTYVRHSAQPEPVYEFIPIIRYDDEGFVQPLSQRRLDLAEYAELVRSFVPNIAKTLTGGNDFMHLFGTFPYGTLRGTFDFPDETPEASRILFSPGPAIMPELAVFHRSFNLSSLMRLDRSGYDMHQRDELYTHVLANALGVDVLQRAQTLTDLVRSKMDLDALERAGSAKLRGDGRIAAYGRALAVGDTLDTVNEHQPGVHALYRLIYASELSRRRSHKKTEETNEAFMNMDDKTAIATVKFAVGDALTKGQWKHLTRMTDKAMATVVGHSGLNNIPLKLRKTKGWLMTSERGHTRNFAKRLMSFHEFKLGTKENDPLEEEIMTTFTSYNSPLEIDNYHLRRNMEGPITQAETERRRENLQRSIKAFIVAYRDSTEAERETVQQALNDGANGQFGTLSFERMMMLVRDWLRDIQPILDKNQLRAPLKWWFEQQQAWHLAHGRAPGMSWRDRQADLTWEAGVEEAEMRVRDDTGEHHRVIAHALTSGKALQDEGRAMSHCVGSYASRCAQGQTLIYSLTDAHSNRLATLELRERPNGTWVRGQCLAKYNKQPPEHVKQAADRFVTRFNEELIRRQKESEDTPTAPPPSNEAAQVVAAA